jgi:hypothetical protein
MAEEIDPMWDPPQQEDPLKAWLSQMNDPGLAALMVTNPEKAKEIMIQKGMPPPPDSASAFTDPATGMNVPGASPFVRTNPDGTIAGNLSNPPDPDIPLPTPDPRKTTAPPPQVTPQPTLNALDPEENPNPVPEGSVPTPLARPTEAGPPNKAKPSVSDALSDFSKSLAGVKPIPPPPLNPVGTPQVHAPNALRTPDIASLLALAGQSAQAGKLATLGRLLATGKA